MLYITLDQDHFSEILTRLDFGDSEPYYNEALFGKTPHLRLISADIVNFGARVLILVMETGAWCLLDEFEFQVYKTLQDHELYEVLAQFPGMDLQQLKEFVARLYWRGLLEANGRPFLEPDILMDRPIFVSGPLFLMVPTEQCNLACTYCFANSGPLVTNLMDWDTAAKTVDLIIDYPSNSLTIEFAGGEPLCEHGLIRNVVNYARQRADRFGKAVQFLMQTNATLITSSIAKLIKELDIHVGVSLDGDPAINNTTRFFPGDKGAYEAIEKGISELRREEVPFGVICVVSKCNYRNLPEVLRHFSFMGLGDVKLNPVFELGRAGGKWKILALTPEEFLETHEAYLDYVESEESPVVDDNTLDMMRNLAGRMRPYRCMRSQCGAGKDFLTFTPTGDIYPCSRFRNQAALTLGNVFTIDRLEGLWKTNSIISILADRKAEAIPECRQCNVKRFCEAGCPLDSYNRFRSVDAVHPWCAYYKGIYKTLLRRIADGPDLVEKLCPEAKIYNKTLFGHATV